MHTKHLAYLCSVCLKLVTILAQFTYISKCPYQNSYVVFNISRIVVAVKWLELIERSL